MSEEVQELGPAGDQFAVLPTDVDLLAALISAMHLSGIHSFSTGDIIGGYDGVRVANDPGILDTAGTGTVPEIQDKSGNFLSPIDSEFGFLVEDFYEAFDKERDGIHAEGWAGNVSVTLDSQMLAGLSLINAETDTFKSGQPLGTWAAGLGGNSVKASTEHYAVMAALLSDQAVAGDGAADYPLDNDLRLIDFDRDPMTGDLIPDALNGNYVKELVEALETAIANVGSGNPITVTDVDLDHDGTADPYTTLTVQITADPDGDGTPQTVDVGGVDLDGDGVADFLDSRLNGFGVADLADILQPNDSSVYQDIAYGDDYSVTLKDDGKLLFRWGTEIKRPNDIRLGAELDLPSEWTDGTDADDDGIADALGLNEGLGYLVTRAELVILHTVTNNPNDQVRPEDFENEGATGRLPAYYVVRDPDDASNTLWVSPRDSYSGAGDALPSYFRLTDEGAIDMAGGGTAVYDPVGVLVGYRNTDDMGAPIGTVLRDLSLVAQNGAAKLEFTSGDLADGFTNEWYVSTDRDPFEWSYDRAAANPYVQDFVGFRSSDEAAMAGFGPDELSSGPRWRLTANKFGQDIPGLEIPLEENSAPPYQSNNIRYEVGTLTTTTLNLLDWADDNGNGLADDSPLRFSSGWMTIDPTRLDLDGDGVIDAGWTAVNGALGEGDAMPEGPILTAISPNGMTLTPDFLDIAVYLKGDRQGNANIFSMQLELEYETLEAAPEPLFASLSAEAGTPSLAEMSPALIAAYDGLLAVKPGDGAVDLDQPLNTAPDFESVHVFSTDDVTGGFDGTTQGELAVGDVQIVDFTADPVLTRDGVALYPINSEFGFLVEDFDGAVERDFTLNPEYVEGLAGNLTGTMGEQLGIVVSNAPTDTFLTPARMGTWLVGMGGDSVKASTEHYSVMQAILSDQHFPEDPDADYVLDDDLVLVGGAWDGQHVEDVLAIVGDLNGDGATDIRDVLAPNEASVTQDIAVSSDYSVTLKDDGKLLYRWGNMIKKPVDIRLSAQMDLPDEWGRATDTASGLKALYRVSQAELVVSHTITNNPNDQVRPEDFENEAAIGRLPDYEIDPMTGRWLSVADYYAGDGTFYPAGTVLRDPAVATAVDGSLLDRIGARSEDLELGLLNPWYTTMDREPFEPVLTPSGDDYEVGPRWRLKDNKYGQDLPGVEIPLDPSQPPPPTKSEIKYEVGAPTQTVLNLLDWEGVSPFTLNAGWQDGAGTVTVNGLKMSGAFDMAFYVKGDIKDATINDARLVMSYEAVPISGPGTSLFGAEADDVLVGMGGNTFNGGLGMDLFVIAYGATDPSAIAASTIRDFGNGADALGLIDLGVTEANFDARITQTVSGDNLGVALDGTTIAVLEDVAAPLDLEQFYLANVEVPPLPVPRTEGDRNADGKADLLWRLADGTVRGLLTDGDEADIATVSGDWRVVDVTDLSGDGGPDLLWRNDTTGGTWHFQLDGNTVAMQGGWGDIGLDWHIVASPDLDGDGRSDILWRNDSGALYGWRMDGASLLEAASLGDLSTAWHLLDVSDLDADGKDDLLWRNDDGTVYGWLMDGIAIKDQGGIAAADPAMWKIAATPDLDGNGTADLLWIASGGGTHVQLLDGTTTIDEGGFGSLAGWGLVGTADLDEDGDDDLVWQNETTDQRYGWLMDGRTIAAQGSIGSAAGADVIDFLDTNGDGRADIQMREDGTGMVRSQQMNGLVTLDTIDLAVIPETALHLTGGVGLWDDGGMV